MSSSSKDAKDGKGAKAKDDEASPSKPVAGTGKYDTKTDGSDSTAPAARKPPISSLSRLPPPRDAAARAPSAAAAPAAPSGSLTSGTDPSVPSAHPPSPPARVGSGVAAVSVAGGVSTAELVAELMAGLEARLDAKLATISALGSLPTPPSGAAPKSKAKTAGTLQRLIVASGHSAKSGEDDATSNAGERDAAADADDADADPNQSEDADADDAEVTAGARKPKLSTAIDLSKPVGRLLWKEEIAPYNSALSYVRMNTFREARNRHECEAFALSLDEMVRERIPMTSVSFEIQIRRLIGVRVADEYKDWSFAEALAWKSGHGVQHRGLLRSLLKDRKNFADLKKPPTTATAAQSFARGGAGRGRKTGGAGRGGRGGRGGYSKPSSGGTDAARN